MIPEVILATPGVQPKSLSTSTAILVPALTSNVSVWVANTLSGFSGSNSYTVIVVWCGGLITTR